MGQPLQLGLVEPTTERGGIRRINRLPVAVAIAITLIFLGLVVTGLSWRGMGPGGQDSIDRASDGPATSFGESLKRGISDGIIGDEGDRQAFQPAPPALPPTPTAPPDGNAPLPQSGVKRTASQTKEDWRSRLLREQEEQISRERNRQRMARLQAEEVALDAPLTIDMSAVGAETLAPGKNATRGAAGGIPDRDETALRLALAPDIPDQNGQASKEAFFNQDIQDLGYLPNRVVPQMSRYELKRGSVIPATLITGLNSDLPGRLIAQVSQDVYDSATGLRLLIPQGARLFGRYDSKVAFGQQRALVVWTDLIFPDGATLQIGGMAGTDAQGYGGFTDKVDRHLWRVFGSAALIAVIGTGIDMSLPESSTLATRDTASDAARRNFAETFGRAAEQTISKNLNVQPTLRIRPGYQFNVMVDQDLVLPERGGNP